MDLGKLNILVVEKNDDIKDQIVNKFNSLNYLTKSASNFETAKTLISEIGKFQDLFLIDLEITGGDGFDLIRKITEIKNDANIIIITSNINNKLILKEIKNGCYSIIERPFSIESDILPISSKYLKHVLLKRENEYLNEQILHNSKLAIIGELSASIVHDIRGPLSTIQLLCEDLKEEFKKENKIDECFLNSQLFQIDKACNKINKLVDYLRGYSRKENNEKEDIKNLMNLIENSLFLVTQKIRNLKIKVNIDVDKNITNIQIKCFSVKFEQVLMNLISNACDAMKDSNKRELTIKVYLEDESLLILVSDTGVGISEEIIPKIFDSFYTTKPKGEGTGLGLSIVKNIVLEHSGELFLNSEIGKGSTFTIKLPSSKLVLNSYKEEASGASRVA